MSGLQIFNAHPALVPRQDLDLRPSAGHHRRHRRRRPRLRRSLRPPLRHHRRARRLQRQRPSRPRAAFPRGSRCRPFRISRRAGAGTSCSPGFSSLNGLVYLLFGLIVRPVAAPADPDWSRTAVEIGASLREHLRLHFPQGEAATRYNVHPEAHLSRGRARPAAAADSRRPRHVARHRRMRALAARRCSAAGRARAPSISSSRSLLVLFVLVHLVMVVLSRAVQQSARHDHRLVRHSSRRARRPHETDKPLDRRRFLIGGLGARAAPRRSAAAIRLPPRRPGVRRCRPARTPAKFVQRLLLTPQAMAQEFTEADISPAFKPNGSTDPTDEAYKALAADNFADYRLKIGGLVEKPFEISLAELRALPSRTQITRHDCVEGWSCIGKWNGAPLAIAAAARRPQAGGALYRVPLFRLDGQQRSRIRQGRLALLRKPRSRRRLPSTDDRRL